MDVEFGLDHPMPLIEPDEELSPTRSRPVTSRISSRPSIVDQLLASPFEISSTHGPGGDEGRRRVARLAEEQIPVDDDDLGRGIISPLSSPLSTRRCQSIVEPLEDRFAALPPGEADDAEGGAHEEEEDLFDENAWSWKERAKVAEAQLSSREEQLEAQLTAREDANRRLLAELTKKQQELALRDMELQNRDAELQKLRKQLNDMSAHQELKAQECASVAAWLQERRIGILTDRGSANALATGA